MRLVRQIEFLRESVLLQSRPAPVLNHHLHGRPKGSVVIMRPSKWGNPYKVGRDAARGEAVEMFAQGLKERFDLLDALDELRDRPLVCCCAPRLCHGNVLSVLAAMSVEQRILWVAGEPIPHYVEKLDG